MTEPTDAEIIALADETRTAEGGASGYILPISFARAVLAKWGAQPVPAGYALVPVEPTPEMVDAAQEAYMPFGDMQLAIQLAIAAAQQPVAREPLSAEQYNILVEDLSEWSRYVEVDTAPRSLEEHIHQVFAIHGIKRGQHGAE